MSRTGLEVFDRTLPATNHWLKLMMIELGTDDRRLAFNALRGAYDEGWRPARTPTRERRLEDFLDHVASGMPDQDNVGAEDAARAGFAVMAQCLDPGEMDKLLRVLPSEARYLWPEGMVH